MCACGGHFSQNFDKWDILKANLEIVISLDSLCSMQTICCSDRARMLATQKIEIVTCV